MEHGMTISFSCPRCGTFFRVDDDKSCKRTKCAACRLFLQVPAKSSEETRNCQLEKSLVIRTTTEPVTEDEIYRILEETEEGAETAINYNAAATETSISMPALSSTPAAMPPVTDPIPTKTPPFSCLTAAEAAESALKRARKARRLSNE